MKTEIPARVSGSGNIARGGSGPVPKFISMALSGTSGQPSLMDLPPRQFLRMSEEDGEGRSAGELMQTSGSGGSAAVALAAAPLAPDVAVTAALVHKGGSTVERDNDIEEEDPGDALRPVGGRTTIGGLSTIFSEVCVNVPSHRCFGLCDEFPPPNSCHEVHRSSENYPGRMSFPIASALAHCAIMPLTKSPVAACCLLCNRLILLMRCPRCPIQLLLALTMGIGKTQSPPLLQIMSMSSIM